MQHDPHLKPKKKEDQAEGLSLEKIITTLGEQLGEQLAESEEKEILGANAHTHRDMQDLLDPTGMVPRLKDSGERRQFKTGAVRDRAVGKGRFDLIPTQMNFRLARHYEAGAIKYSDRNWEKGMEFSVYVDAAKRHLEKYVAGWMDEDHLAAAIWNIAALMFMEERMPELDDLPERKREAVDMFKWVVRKPEDA